MSIKAIATASTHVQTHGRPLRKSLSAAKQENWWSADRSSKKEGSHGSAVRLSMGIVENATRPPIWKTARQMFVFFIDQDAAWQPVYIEQGRSSAGNKTGAHPKAYLSKEPNAANELEDLNKRNLSNFFLKKNGITRQKNTLGDKEPRKPLLGSSRKRSPTLVIPLRSNHGSTLSSSYWRPISVCFEQGRDARLG